MGKGLRILAAGAVIGGILLAGGWVFARNRATEPECSGTQPTEVSTALETTQPQTLPTEPPVSLRVLRCREAAAEMEAGCIFVYDPEGEEMVYCSTDPEDKVYPASITKLFAAWVALRFLPGDAVVTVGWELGMLEPGSSSAFLALDSRLTVEDLIRGMLLPSGNDAALVLAAAAGREITRNPNATAREAVAEFVAEMNRAAQAVALCNTHFENPHGCHSENHFSCPADLAVIGALALEESIIRSSMGLSEITVTARSGERYTWRNTNRLVRPETQEYIPEALGMKTGYTSAAGYCLMAAFDADAPLLVGIFGCSDSETRYGSAAELYRLWSAEEELVQAASLHQQIQGGAG